eukprot:5081686-Lingulodinium_polyedra.AAC.1
MKRAGMTRAGLGTNEGVLFDGGAGAADEGVVMKRAGMTRAGLSGITTGQGSSSLEARCIR